MSTEKQCACATAPKLVFPCSGASDVGEITDRAARQLTKRGKGRMYCLAGIGGHIPDMIENTKKAAKILVIDGCPQDCARKTMDQGGFSKFEYLRLSDMGLEKGKTLPDHENISKVVAKGAQILEC
ncbi:MAG: putative zinc-binding protein [Verrucomicrobiae bacterium]|nr:putative zinc-binding protein [Verrucomicrobiae bacterium]